MKKSWLHTANLHLSQIALSLRNKFHTIVLPSPLSNWACACHRKLQCFPFIFSETPCGPAAVTKVALAQLFDHCDACHAAAASYIVQQFTQMWTQWNTRLHITHGLMTWRSRRTTLPGFLAALDLGWLQPHLQLKAETETTFTTVSLCIIWSAYVKTTSRSPSLNIGQ